MNDADDQSRPAPDRHRAFDLLAPGVQRQLYAMKWPSLRPLQTRAIKAWFESDDHLLLMAETAAGKTEAAFLPILSSICDEPAGSVRALYIGPLKALINDQFARLEHLATHLDLPVHRWHGDVAQSRKEAVVRDPAGVLLLTPESLESLLINRTASLGTLLGGLRAIVIDELHAFLDGERGRHLASLLARLARVRSESQPPWRMLGLSATVGDPATARAYLSPNAPGSVRTITDDGEASEILLRVHGYGQDDRPPKRDPITFQRRDSKEPPSEPSPTIYSPAMKAVAADLIEHCRSHTNLVFANARGDIEMYGDCANRICRDRNEAETFLVHHGSLSKQVREEAEAEMKSHLPRTTICSSTLEMGVDIGSVRMVGQIGAPWSVSSLKQRMGRSGRGAGASRRLRCYCHCAQSPELDPKDPLAQIPRDLLQTIAICELMLEGWTEPPRTGTIDFSTLSQQIISTIAESGTIRVPDLFERLCREGPFRAVCADLFARLLTALGRQDVIEQDAHGALLLGLRGESLRSRQDFYAAFTTPFAYSVVAADRLLGTLPITVLPEAGDHLVFAGRRWKIASLDTERSRIYLEPSDIQKRPVFTGSGGVVHHNVVERMRRLLREDGEIVYLDTVAATALQIARRGATASGVTERGIVSVGENQCLWMTWTGTLETMTFHALLRENNISAENRQIALSCACSEQRLHEVLEAARHTPPDLRTLAKHILPKQRRKYDDLLPDDLLEEDIASDLIWRDPLE